MTAEPIVLVAAGDPDNTPLLYACAGCGAVQSPAIYLAKKEVQHATAKEAARDCYTCKTHSNCQYCGAECDKGWTACAPCRFQRKLDAAVEVPDDGGPYCAFDGDTYYTEMEEAADAGLEWVSPCEVTYPKIDADSVLENLLDEMHEDASVDDMDGVDAFYAAVKAFNDAQRTQSWFGDVKRKIRVPAPVIAARSDETPQAVQPEGQVSGAQSADAHPPTLRLRRETVTDKLSVGSTLSGERAVSIEEGVGRVPTASKPEALAPSRIDITEAERGAVIAWLQRRAVMCLDEVRWHQPIRGLWLRHLAAAFRAAAWSIKECAHLATTMEEETTALSRAQRQHLSPSYPMENYNGSE